MEKVYLQYWEEASREFGVRPYGCSLHLSTSDINLYVESIYKNRGIIIPNEYDRVVGGPIPVMISTDVYNKILTGNTMRIDETSLNNMRRLGDIKIIFQDELPV